MPAVRVRTKAQAGLNFLSNMRRTTEGFGRASTGFRRFGETIRETGKDVERVSTRDFSKFGRNLRILHIANRRQIESESGIQGGLEVGVSVAAGLTTAVQVQQLLSTAKQGTLWARAAARIASWGPLFWIPLGLILAGLAAVAFVAGQQGFEAPREPPDKRFGPSGRALGATTRTDITRNLTIRQDNTSADRTRAVLAEMLRS